MSNDPTQRRKKAESLYAEKQWAEAAQLFEGLRSEAAAQGQPEDGDLIHDHAVCIFQLGRTKEALQQFDRAVELEPDHPYRYASRAWIRAAMKDVDGAIEDYRKALELDPDDAIALNNLGLLEEQYGMRKSAQERFRRADTLMGILKDAGVDPPQEAEPTPTPPRKETEEPAPPSSVLREMGAVFTSKTRRKEFLNFIKKGLRG